jgi:hypothetical protein
LTWRDLAIAIWVKTRGDDHPTMRPFDSALRSRHRC